MVGFCHVGNLPESHDDYDDYVDYDDYEDDEDYYDYEDFGDDCDDYGDESSLMTMTTMTLMMIWQLAVTPGVKHFGAYHRPPDGHFFLETVSVLKQWSA